MSRPIQSCVKNPRIGIIGGGIAGATVALCLGELGLDVTLIEKGSSLVNGPPICHLHAGGNLYREISDAQCFTLLRESIDLVRLYPHAVDYRPTVIAVPKNDAGLPEDLLPRLHKLQKEYQHLINKDSKNSVLGASEHYFKLFTRQQIEALKNTEVVNKPQTLTEWMIPFAHHVNLEQLKFPVILVQEYGLNLFRLAASAELALRKITHCSLLVNSEVTNIHALANCWQVEYQQGSEITVTEFDYLINAAGFRTGTVDDMLDFKRQRLVEFKAAYVTQWPQCSAIWPEVIFFGDRGTPEGMAQFTPYPDGYFQLHGMTPLVTLFDNGLVESANHSAQPQLNPHFIEKIDKGWSNAEINLRSQAAIDHISRFIPDFAQNATVSAKPLFGAQQIPGDDAELRAAGVSFVGEFYARCEIVKASSALTVSNKIIKQLIKLGYLTHKDNGDRVFKITHAITEPEITQHAQKLCASRDYPVSLARCNFPQLGH
ncbi:FAD-dependent oxidoreductase [Psychromonas hadalis]|uniref:FAD-dependent oxidoreductase n=1 Tax=Psychromonas hadalis TaxID=211669 RepID=UPI0003B4ABDE|nr:FAD-dependent oxidoreductase [Psychromonas hadalis]